MSRDFYLYTKNLNKDDLYKKSGVYIILNKITNKYYIGGTINLFDRFRLHYGELIKNKHHNSMLQRAWNKYGAENFEFDILEYHDIDYVFDMENYWITLLKATDKKFGYNLNKHSKTRLGAILNDKTKEKISKSLKEYYKRGDYKKRIKENPPNYRKFKIVQLDLNGNFIKEYSSITDAGLENNIFITSIVSNLKKKKKTCKGFVFVYKNEYDSNKDYSTYRYKYRSKVGQFDMEENLIKVFKNSTEAAESLNISKDCINTVCIYHKTKKLNANGIKNISYKGYIWKYMEN